MGDMRDDDVHATREEAKVLAARAAHNSVFFSGSMAAKKLMAPVKIRRVKTQQQQERAEHLTQQLRSDADIVNRRIEQMRQSSNKKYGDKIAKKRKARGMSIGACHLHCTANLRAQGRIQLNASIMLISVFYIYRKSQRILTLVYVE
eukprot:COSAG01_NODE_5834_length_4006_cov_2.108267_1_plen_147_part_10